MMVAGGLFASFTALVASPSLFSCMRASKAVFLLDILNEYTSVIDGVLATANSGIRAKLGNAAKTFDPLQVKLKSPTGRDRPGGLSNGFFIRFAHLHTACH